MSKQCQIYGKAIYVDCQECKDTPCKYGNIMKMRHNVTLSKGDIICATAGNCHYYYVYVGKRNGVRVLFNILKNEEIEVGEKFFCRYEKVKVN